MHVDHADLEQTDVEVTGKKFPRPPAKLGVVETDQGALVIAERHVLEPQVFRKSSLEISPMVNLLCSLLASPSTNRANCARPDSVRR